MTEEFIWVWIFFKNFFSPKFFQIWQRVSFLWMRPSVVPTKPSHMPHSRNYGIFRNTQFFSKKPPQKNFIRKPEEFLKMSESLRIFSTRWLRNRIFYREHYSQSQKSRKKFSVVFVIKTSGKGFFLSKLKKFCFFSFFLQEIWGNFFLRKNSLKMSNFWLVLLKNPFERKIPKREEFFWKSFFQIFEGSLKVKNWKNKNFFNLFSGKPKDQKVFYSKKFDEFPHQSSDFAQRRISFWNFSW